MPLTVGTKLGPYEIVSPLGLGGMGEVYKARDTRLGRLVALKVLPADFKYNSDRRHRFEREARAVAALNHPNVVSVYDVGDDYFVSELVDGDSMRGMHLPLRKAIDIGAQIADGLAAAHAAGITHRDLKPDNVLLTRDGRVKILDFGLAKLDPAQNQQTTLTATDPGVVMGTIGYMSPEQVRGKTVDHRSDIFNFGLVLYELLSGKRAFERDTSAETMAAIAKEEPPQLSSTVPGGLRHIVARCLEKEPTNRFQSAIDLVFALRTLSGVDGSGVQVRPVRAKITRVWTGWKVVALLVALALGCVIWIMLRKPAGEIEGIHLSLNPPSGLTFSDNGAVVSPDGRLIAFVGVGQGKQSLWVRPLRSTEARELPGTDAAMYPFWSADSKSIGFFSVGKLKRVKAAGGAVEELCSAPNGRGGTWNSDGVIVFAPAAGTGLQQVSASGGEPTVLTEMDAGRQETEHRWPQFLPDGRRFLYWIMSAKPEHRGVHVSSLSAPEQRIRVVGTNFFAQYAPRPDGAAADLLWVRGETLVAQRFDAAMLRMEGDAVPIAEGVGRVNLGFAYFSVSNNGVLVYAVGSLGKRQIEWRHRKGKVLDSEGSAGVYYSPRISPEGSGVAITRVDPPNSDIWIYDLYRRVMTRLTIDPGFDNYAVWSPDGGHLAFSASRAGPRNVYIRPSRSSGREEQLTQSPYPQSPSDWSRDGRYLLYTEVHPATASDLWLLPMQGGGAKPKPEPFLVTQFDERNARFSPDGKWIVYASNESGSYEVYVQPFPATGKKWLISNRSGSQPVWRSDGRELFYLAGDGRVMSVDVTTAAVALIFSRPHELLQIPVRLGVPYYDYDVTADGQRFLVLAPAAGSTPEPLNVLINWHAALRP